MATVGIKAAFATNIGSETHGETLARFKRSHEERALALELYSFPTNFPLNFILIDLYTIQHTKPLFHL
ncbi:hypothetical protein TWF281_008380 [Arthrobotrys megalospora]